MLKTYAKRQTKKIIALARLSNYTDLVKLKLLRDALIKSQFNYCPLVWMFHDRTINSNVSTEFVKEHYELYAKIVEIIL